MYVIETNRADRIIYLRMFGLFTNEVAKACAAAKETAVVNLGPPFDAHSTLLDIRDFRVQPQEIFAVFTSFVAKTRHKSRKIAVVVGEGTARMQFRRVVEREALRDDMLFFTEMSEAREWLGKPAHDLVATRPAQPGIRSSEKAR